MKNMESLLTCQVCLQKYGLDEDQYPRVLPNGQTFCTKCISNSIAQNNGQFVHNDIVVDCSGHKNGLPRNEALITLIRSHPALSPADAVLQTLDSTELSVDQLQDVKNAVEKQLVVAVQRERETRRKALITERTDCLRLISSCDDEVAALKEQIIAHQHRKTLAEQRVHEIASQLSELQREISQSPSQLLSEAQLSPHSSASTITMDSIRFIQPINARYICPICGIACKSSTKLQNHAETEHNLS